MLTGSNIEIFKEEAKQSNVFVPILIDDKRNILKEKVYHTRNFIN